MSEIIRPFTFGSRRIPKFDIINSNNSSYKYIILSLKPYIFPIDVHFLICLDDLNDFILFPDFANASLRSNAQNLFLPLIFGDKHPYITHISDRSKSFSTQSELLKKHHFLMCPSCSITASSYLDTHKGDWKSYNRKEGTPRANN